MISISLHAAEGLLNLGMDRNRHPEMGKACVCVWGGGVRRMGPGRKWFCRRVREVSDDCLFLSQKPPSRCVCKRHSPDPGSAQRAGVRRNPLRKHEVPCRQDVSPC